MKKTRLRAYARLIAGTGVNVQKGQAVRIIAELEQPEFVAMLTEECYRLGASKVTVDWMYQPLTKLHVRYQSLRTLSAVEDWEKARLQHYVDTVPCRIFLLSEDPDGLKGIRREKYTVSSQRRMLAIKPYRDQLDGKEQWCIASVPGRGWAKKVFPELRPAAAVEKLWEAILDTSRVTDDPEAAWREHNENLHKRCAYLNSLGIRRLHYTAANGTDLTVGLIPEGRFCAGREETVAGIAFNPNIPSEECFISPKRGEADGIVYSSKPLAWEGDLIDRFWFKFEGGRVVDCGAEVNDALLHKLVKMDDGAAYLGECALVPFESPINQTGILFYNTLFDENACCHLALGRGFFDTIRDFQTRTREEMHALGVNDSIIHEDFMIGTDDLNIDAETADGKTVPIFRNGTWAF